MRHLSDEEYIEKVRKSVNTVNRFRWFWPILFVSFFACLIKFVDLIQKIEPKPDNDGVMGFALGITFGVILVFTSAQAAHCLKNWWDAYRGWRTERLLLKYYDEKEANQRGTHGDRHGRHGIPSKDHFLD